MNMTVLIILKIICSMAAMNWGMVVFFNYNVIDYTLVVCGATKEIHKIFYAIIGLSGIGLFVSLFA